MHSAILRITRTGSRDKAILASVPQVDPNDEITAESVNQGANALAVVVNGGIDDTNVSTLSGTKLTASTIPGSAMTAEASPYTRLYESMGDFVASGGVWSPLTGLNATMSAAVSYIAGKRLTTAMVTSYAFTASKDTYVYIDLNGVVQYSALANGSSVPATPANNLLVAKVVTNGSAVAVLYNDRILAPASTKPNFRAYLSNAYALGASGDVVHLDAENRDTLNNFSTSTYRFTAQHTGTYEFKAAVNHNIASGNALYISLFKNGSETSRGTEVLASATFDFSSAVADDIELVAGDYVEVRISGTVGNQVKAGAFLTYFAGSLKRQPS
ncbi:C1q-like domain-containing protein [Naasia lichenicola]|uniref:C1q domain-containing protein n=1 Tax=Naasia lichenicola TaxID=2565933 RepID=A0A4S4FKI8_9MICO|nr:hypothetical protein [Naasia lichenicola]THG30671.1 hypothetical protein E6C64_08505 [Naasia lichenicola]THG31908.1 hypothetical protein E6C64_07650 [Naasia lichenicola]